MGSGRRWGEPWGSSLSPSSSPLHRTVFFQLEAEATPLLCAIGRHPCALASGCQHMGGTWPEAKAASCFSAVTPGHALGGWTEARAYSAAACEPSPAEPLDRHPTRCRRMGAGEPGAEGRRQAGRCTGVGASPSGRIPSLGKLCLCFGAFRWLDKAHPCYQGCSPLHKAS